MSSVALTFFAFLGFGVITFTAKDLADPARQLPRAVYLALGIATVIYVAVALGVFGTLTVDEVIASGGTALAVAAEPVLGRAGYWLMTVTALFATAGATNSGLYPAAGLCDEMAATGQFPPSLGRRLGGRAPAGIVVTAVAAAVLAVGFDLTAIASIGSAVALIVFALVSAGHLRVRHETGANLAMLVLAIASAVIVLVAFAFTTLVDEPGTAIALVVILLLSIVLDAVWKRAGAVRRPTSSRASASNRRRREMVGMRWMALSACVVLALAACGGDDDAADEDPVAAAEARVSEAEDELADAQDAFDEASDTFCADGADYVEGVDRYGSLVGDDAVTVGDVTTAGDDLEEPREAAQASADEAVAAHERVATAEQELAEAQVALAEAQSGTTAPAEDTTTTTAPLVPTATVERVDEAEDDLASAFEGVTESTPLADATEEVNAAAFALEVASLRLLADAGCLTDEQQTEAVDAVTSYTATLQGSLATAGYLDDEVDGIYGPGTVAAVEELQAASDLPVTGFVDRATAAALDEAVQAAGGDAAAAEVADTAALQATLALGGYWTGPIDGQWTDALTAALEGPPSRPRGPRDRCGRRRHAGGRRAGRGRRGRGQGRGLGGVVHLEPGRGHDDRAVASH